MMMRPVNPDRPLKLAMHTYSLHFWGFGSSWGIEDYVFPKMFSLYDLMDKAVEWKLDGLHVTRADLESLDPAHLAEVKAEADKRELFLDFNASFDDVDPRCNVTPREAIEVAKIIGSDIVKWGLDIKRPRQLTGSRFHPEVVKQIMHRMEQFEEVLPLLEENHISFAIENHTDTFADEVIWIIEQMNHPNICACIDTMNPLYVMEEPEVCIKKMLPYSIYTHFSDDAITCDLMGVHSIGGAIGEGAQDLPKVLKWYRELSPMDRITFENEYCLEYRDEPLEKAREREMAGCIRSIEYLRNVLGLGLRDR